MTKPLANKGGGSGQWERGEALRLRQRASDPADACRVPTCLIVIPPLLDSHLELVHELHATKLPRFPLCLQNPDGTRARPVLRTTWS